MKKTLRLVYIIGTYPSLTITFIDREIRILRRWGVDLQILAVHRQAADMPLSADQRALHEGVVVSSQKIGAGVGRICYPT